MTDRNAGSHIAKAVKERVLLRGCFHVAHFASLNVVGRVTREVEGSRNFWDDLGVDNHVNRFVLEVARATMEP